MYRKLTFLPAIEKHLEKLPLYIKMEPTVIQRTKELEYNRAGYDDIENRIFYNDVWHNLYYDCADVLKCELIFRDIENPLVTQMLDDNGYIWRCLINSVRPTSPDPDQISNPNFLS